MNPRSILGFLIVSISLLVDALLSPAVSSENNQTDPALTLKKPVQIDDANNNNSGRTQEQRIIIYYFYRTIRCETCIEIEKLTLEAVNEAFEKELSKGTVEIKIINMEEAENRHFADDYKLRAQSVIVSDMAVSNEMRWKILDKIWNYVSDEEEFKEYIIAEVRAYL